MFGSSVLTEPGRSDVLRQQFDTNFFGLVDVTNGVLPHMRNRSSGTIVLIGSRASWVPEIPVSVPRHIHAGLQQSVVLTASRPF